MMLSNKKLANPFVYQGYESPAYFCDREAETKTLLSHLKNSRKGAGREKGKRQISLPPHL